MQKNIMFFIAAIIVEIALVTQGQPIPSGDTTDRGLGKEQNNLPIVPQGYPYTPTTPSAPYYSVVPRLYSFLQPRVGLNEPRYSQQQDLLGYPEQGASKYSPEQVAQAQRVLGYPGGASSSTPYPTQRPQSNAYGSSEQFGRVPQGRPAYPLQEEKKYSQEEVAQLLRAQQSQGGASSATQYQPQATQFTQDQVAQLLRAQQLQGGASNMSQYQPQATQFSQEQVAQLLRAQQLQGGASNMSLYPQQGIQQAYPSPYPQQPIQGLPQFTPPLYPQAQQAYGQAQIFTPPFYPQASHSCPPVHYDYHGSSHCLPPSHHHHHSRHGC
ncbi:PAX-interacting protein 1-like isoform X3 [Adelges cooleyi]|uniref:PAX-interacting protein 1-like isoform X3 n=1 Tax=Adelges cooleyi TaxID=133065 RepID=UPI00217FB061|nr:PAX-interacting protein 1-like isoform X3 [Adelges cooleyi]